jgi:DNA repair protein RadC
MYTASLSNLKKELKSKSDEELLAICLRLGRYKKENKELIHYLLLEAHDDAAYVEQIKADIAEGFETINDSNLYYAKKGIRKVLRVANKHIKYSGNKTSEVEVLLYFVKQIRDMDIPIQNSKVLVNLYLNQIKKIEKALSTLHEDLQYDYNLELEALKQIE